MPGKVTRSIRLASGPIVQITVPINATRQMLQDAIAEQASKISPDIGRDLADIGVEPTSYFEKAAAPKSALAAFEPRQKSAQEITAPLRASDRRDTLTATPDNPLRLGTGEALKAGVGDIVSGVAGVASIPNWLINTVAGTNLSTDMGEQARDLLGLPRGNPYAETVNKFGAEALAMGGAGRAALPFLGPTGQAVAGGLGADEPIREGIAGAGAGLATEAAEQAGLPGWAQLGLGLAGGVGAYGATSPAVRNVLADVAGDEAGMFLPGNLRPDMLAKAETMEAGGAGRDEIFEATGMYKQHGDYKFEISDEGLDVKKGLLPGKGKGIKATAVMEHPLLEGYYPEFKGGIFNNPLRVGGHVGGPKIGGAYYPDQHVVTFNPKRPKPLMVSTAAHELQHGLPQVSGNFPIGSRVGENPAIWGGPEVEALEAAKKRFTDLLDTMPDEVWLDPAVIKHLRAFDDEIDREALNEGYRRSAGEVEARNVQTRLNWTDEERRLFPPWVTQDRADELQIVKRNEPIQQWTPDMGPKLSVDDVTPGEFQPGQTVTTIGGNKVEVIETRPSGLVKVRMGDGNVGMMEPWQLQPDQIDMSGISDIPEPAPIKLRPSPPQTTSTIKIGGPTKLPDFELGYENPLNWRERVIDGGGVEIRPFQGNWHITGIRALEPGGGRRALETVIKEADRLGITLDLTAEPLDTMVGKKMSKKDLVNWYKQFGFTGSADNMVRKPGSGEEPLDLTGGAMQASEDIPEGLQPGRSDAVSRAFEGVTDYDGARKVAEAGGHLKADKSGKLIGSPDLTQKQLGAWRGRLDQLIADAKQMGLGWYEDVRKVIDEVSETPEQASLMARGGAAYSPQASPTQETNYFLRHHNERVLSGEEPVITTGQRASTVNKGYGAVGENSGLIELTPENINLGKKTGPYGVSKDPTVPMGWEAASDLWHGRALEYAPNEGQEAFDRAFSDTEHAFIKGENVLALERAKAAGTLPPDATVANLQEVVWVKKRYDSFMEKEAARFNAGKRKKQGPPTHEEAMRYALEGVRRGIDRATAVVSREFTPGGGLGEFPGMSADKALNERFASEMGGPGDKKSTEISALQMYQKPGVKGEGYWVDPEEGLQQNPVFMDRPLVGLSPEDVGGKPAGVAMAPRERNALLAYGRLFGLENLQHGVGANIFIPGNSSHKASQLNGMYFGPAKRQEAMDRALAADLDVVDNGDGGIVVTKFTDTAEAAKLVKGFAPDLGGKLGRFDSNYAESGLSAWDKTAGPIDPETGEPEGATVPRPHGTGIATKELLEATGSIPGFEQRLASSSYPEEVAQRNAIRQRYAHELATSLRADVQKLRDLLAQGGPAAVREWVRVHGWKGLPAWAGVLLGGEAMLSSEDQAQPAI